MCVVYKAELGGYDYSARPVVCIHLSLGSAGPTVHNPQSNVGSALTRQLLPEWAMSKLHYTRVYPNYIIYSRCSSAVGMATTLRAGPSAVRIPIMERRFSVLESVYTRSGDHPTSCSMGSGVLTRG